MCGVCGKYTTLNQVIRKREKEDLCFTVEMQFSIQYLAYFGGWWLIAVDEFLLEMIS